MVSHEKHILLVEPAQDDTEGSHPQCGVGLIGTVRTAIDETRRLLLQFGLDALGDTQGVFTQRLAPDAIGGTSASVNQVAARNL